MRYVIVLAVAASCWDSWRWLVQRIAGSPEEGAALALALLLVICTAQCARIGRMRDPGRMEMTVVALLLLAHALSVAIAPPILRLGVAALALLYTLERCLNPSGQRTPPALWLLGLLATPIVPTLQFYLGYPLRLASAAVSVVLLKLNGLAVSREGTYLAWRGELVQFDAPCSGVTMLWAGVLLSAMAGYLFRLSLTRFLLLLTAGGVLVLAGNILRATSLFYLEAGMVPIKLPWLHEAAGVAMFVISALGILWISGRLRPLPNLEQAHAVDETAGLGEGSFWPPAAFSICGLIAFLAPLTAMTAEPGQTQQLGSAPWPTTYGGQPVTQLPLSPREVAFTSDFPGRVGRFSDGSREIIIRQVTSATRKLHPASDCFRGLGYAITPVAMQRNAAGRAMSCFEARSRGGDYRVCEHLDDEAGQSWPDVGAWYWSAVFERGAKTWWSYVVAERI